MSNVTRMPTIGTVRTFHGQIYVMSGRFQRKRKNGSMATVCEWESHCAECGATFTFTCPAASPRFSPNRRCDEHKKPGVRVKKAKEKHNENNP